MNLKSTCLVAVTGIALLGGLTAAPSAAFAAFDDSSVDRSTRDICPPPSHPGDPGSESANSAAVIDSITFSGSGASRIAHVVASGFTGSDKVNYVSWQAFCASQADAFGQFSADADGVVTADVPIVAGVSNFIHFDHSGVTGGGGTLAFFADDSGVTPPTPKPDAPSVALVAGPSGQTTLIVSGHASSPVVVRDAAGRIVAGARLGPTTTRMIVPTPTNETHLSVTQTVDGIESKPALVTLSPGSGARVPAKTRTTTLPASNGTLLTVAGEAGATVEVRDGADRLVGIRRVGSTATVQLIAPQGTPGPVHITQARGGTTSDEELVPVR